MTAGGLDDAYTGSARPRGAGRGADRPRSAARPGRPLRPLGRHPDDPGARRRRDPRRDGRRRHGRGRPRRGAAAADGAWLADGRPDPPGPGRPRTSSASGCAAGATSSRSATSSATSSPTSARSSTRSSPRSGPGSSAGSTRRPTPPTNRTASAASDAALRTMLRDAAARRIDQLDALPRDVGGRIRQLEEYDFMEPAARDRFNALTERLRKQTLDRFVDGLSEAIQGTTPEDLAREPRDGPRPELAARGAARGPRAGPGRGRRLPRRSTAGSSRAPGRSTTSSSS